MTKTDEFDELFITANEALDKKLIKDTLIQYIKINPESGEVIPDTNFYPLANLNKILLYLLARKVLFIKEKLPEGEEVGPTDISNALGIPAGSVKSTLHNASKGILVSVKGKYKIPNYSINKAIDILSSSNSEVETTNKNTANETKTTKRVSKRTSNTASSKNPDEQLTQIASQLDRTKYPQIYELGRVHDQALYLLKILHDDVGIDGMSSSGLSYLLTNIFRVPATRPAVHMVLLDSKYVHRVPQSQKGRTTYIFRIMQPGEDYIQTIVEKLSHNEK